MRRKLLIFFAGKNSPGGQSPQQKDKKENKNLKDFRTIEERTAYYVSGSFLHFIERRNMDCNKTEEMTGMLNWICPVGFVIEVGKGQYFIKRKEKRICCTASLNRARYYTTYEKAEADVKEHLGYIGLNPYICRVCWTLIWAESLEGKWCFWNGNSYDHEEEKAVRFSSYEKAADYQAVHQLQQTGMIEHYCFRDKQIIFAA